VNVEQIKEVLKSNDQIQSLAKELYQQKSILVMGRGYNYATCLEGALVSITQLTFCLFYTYLYSLVASKKCTVSILSLSHDFMGAAHFFWGRWTGIRDQSDELGLLLDAASIKIRIFL